MRIFVDKGKLVQTVNAAVAAGNYDLEVSYSLDFQLFDENGKEATGSFRGTGTITKDSGRTILVLGDPYRDTTLTEYVVSNTPTRESERKLDDFTEGLKKGMGKNPRMSKSASYEWREGFEEGRKLKR